jgi:hypothetical protein
LALSSINANPVLQLTVGCDHLFTGEGFDGGFWLKSSSPLFDGIFDPNPGVPQTGNKKALLPILHDLAKYVESIPGTFASCLQ